MMNSQARVMSLSPDPGERGVEPQLVIDLRSRAKMGLILDLVVTQAAGRGLVMNFQEKLMSLSLDAEERAVELRLAIDFQSKMTKG